MTDKRMEGILEKRKPVKSNRVVLIVESEERLQVRIYGQQSYGLKKI